MRKETMKEMAANMKAAGFEPMGMNALNDLLNETQKKAMLLAADNDRLRAANARLQAWHDAVRSDPWWYDEHGNEIMFRPQPLAKE